MLRKMVSVGGLRVAGIALQSLILILVGRVAGPAGVGALQIFLAWISTVGELTAAGLPTQVMRKLSTMSDNRSRALAYFSRSAVRMTQLWLALMSLAIVLYYFGVLNSSHELGLVAISVFACALMRIASESLKAFYDVDFSVFVENSLTPLIAGFLLLVLHYCDVAMSPTAIVAAFTLGFLVTSLALVARLVSLLREPLKKRTSLPDIGWSEHMPYWATALLSIGFLNFPFMVLPYFADLEDIGAFALAFKLLNICTTILLLLGSIFGPKFSRLAKSGDLVAMKRLLGLSQRLSLLLFIPLAVSLVFAYPHIHIWFGAGFEPGYVLLLILVCGQLINAATGLSGMMLNMCGEGVLEMKVQLFGLALAISLAPIAGTFAGATGIAVVYSLAIALKSLGSLWYACQWVSQDPQFALQTA